MNSVWTEEDKFFITHNAHKMKDKELAEKLQKVTGRKVTLHAVRRIRQSLKIKKCHGRSVCKLANS